jgi:hypothetical protein
MVGRTQAPITTMDWITPNLIACGLHGNWAVVFDRRISNGTATPRINHGTYINHLRRNDNNASHLVIAGLDNKMSLYDLRYAKMDTKAPTNSVFNFDYLNKAHTRIGFDRSIKHNIITAAQDDGTFRVYSSKNGEILRTFQMPWYRLPTGDDLHLGKAVVPKLQIINDDTASFRILALHRDSLWNYGPDDMLNHQTDDNRNWSLDGF